jgi:hypothetical protein
VRHSSRERSRSAGLALECADINRGCALGRKSEQAEGSCALAWGLCLPRDLWHQQVK